MKKISTLFLLVLFFKNISAQYFNYPATGVSTITTNTYTDLGTNGTKITTNFNGQPMGDVNDNSSIQNIGFTFNFGGTDFTTFVLNTNGFIKLGNTSTPLPESKDVLFGNDATTQNVIYPFNNNLQPNIGSTEFRVFTNGTAPNRICTIQFKSLKDSGCTNCSNPNGLPTDAQFGSIEFQILLYETTNVVEFVYGTFLSSGNTAGYVPSNCGLKLNSQRNSTNISKASATAFTNASILDGAYTGNRFNTRNDNLPTSGITYRFTPTILLNNNTQIQSLRFHGKVAKDYNHQISAVVRNIGKTNYTNFPVTLATSGANTFSKTITIASFKSGQTDTVYFNPPAWTNNGNTWNVVTIPNDDDNSNNLDTAKQSVSNLIVGTTFDTAIRSSIGSTSNQIEMATLFRNNTTNKITSCTTFINGAGKQFRFYIYNAGYDSVRKADTPRTKIYSGTTITSVNGRNILNIPAALQPTVTGNFFIVVVQISATVNLGLGYRTEINVRPNHFFFRSPQGSTLPPTSAWFDASESSLPFTKFMVDVAFQNPPKAPIDTPLPVKLNYFTGTKLRSSNILNWQTASEINSKGFDIERSADGKEFTKIGFVESRGNSTSIINYNFIDATPLNVTNYYRLKQIDRDGKFEYSSIVSINNKTAKPLEIVSLFPNPTSKDASLVFNSNKEQKVNINVVNMMGKVVSSQVYNTNSGENRITLNSSALANGTYFVTIAEMDSENFVNTKFIKQ